MSDHKEENKNLTLKNEPPKPILKQSPLEQNESPQYLENVAKANAKQTDFVDSNPTKQLPPDTSASLFSMKAFNAERDLPIVYSDNYNISMLGIEHLHRFDTKKYSKMAYYLSNEFIDTPFARHRYYYESKVEDDGGKTRPRQLRYLSPNRSVNLSELEIYHTPEYIRYLHENKSLVARIMETWILNIVPLALIESRILTPIKWQVAGTIYAFHLAMQHGWAINLGGGFHQGSKDAGETFCLFSDIGLAMKYVWRKHPLQKFMIIDFDAHQATGLERDLAHMESKRRKMIYMLDVFNGAIQPPDVRADVGINQRVELGKFTGDKTYLNNVLEALKQAGEKFNPTLIIYVAGQDVLKDDQLGLLNITDEGLKKRDELVFSFAKEKKCPIVMLLGGGYMSRGTKIQADSIRNLYARGLIWGGQKSGERTLSRPRNKLNKDLDPSQSASKSRLIRSATTMNLSRMGLGTKKGVKKIDEKHLKKI